MGRKPKDKTHLSCRVKPETLAWLDRIATETGHTQPVTKIDRATGRQTITTRVFQGEVVDSIVDWLMEEEGDRFSEVAQKLHELKEALHEKHKT